MATRPKTTDLDTLLQASFKAPWWGDGRERHCAYCGIMMRKRGAKPVPTKATRDHILPTCHDGPSVTLPACHACNSAKGAMDLPEFLSSEHFRAVRARKHGKAWPEHELWAAYAVAVLRKTHDLMKG